MPHEGFSVKNQHWQLVQHALLSLFRRDNPYSPIPFELHVIYESMVVLKKSEIGPLIPEYYKVFVFFQNQFKKFFYPKLKKSGNILNSSFLQKI